MILILIHFLGIESQLPWFKVGGADKFNLDLISRLDKNKFDITIVTTENSDYVWRQKFEKYAEVFDLTSFLHRQDWPAFIHYMIKSRIFIIKDLYQQLFLEILALV